MFGVQVCVFVFEAERQDVLCVKPFLLWDAHLLGVWNAHGYGSARRWEEWISDVGFGEARLWGGGAERLRHRSEADASASAITALSGGPLWNFTLWKADKSSFSPFLLANPSRHTSKHVPALLLFFHMHEIFPTRLAVLSTLCTASHLHSFLSIYESILPNSFTYFSITLDSVVWLSALLSEGFWSI